ncbi:MULTISPECIES: glycosyltransferase family 2 protein [unclassified Enterococcus]|uniref:glycosyltransferase family 2 protein n=1 Tax=unclassified Enterococcus TaxID=2608891 RepID=UPI001553C919|nr:MULTISPECIES: glycosyltransferase family 2 protein [unclassified Enterococcus]MBS7577280.1 glycosyltransferase [Enterococcus sp. MMGLQ5-2]MBS7584627.1 glycosyltransferase [Enterococcus sp. MMGLQ5-1]NPD12482.1 glycosyltransferase [Enterococcus sp. MMGLQ5-1]NPD37114.1 glycosyltransferase [Enterococcus sp. MMGLQ5-2]
MKNIEKSRKPLVSVIITNYNKKLYIKEAVESVFKQDYENFELIIADDCSTDGSIEILKQLEEKYPKIKLILNSENLGIAKNWINVCKLAKGKYIARLDGDDYWLDPAKLSKQVALLEAHVDFGQVYTDYDILNIDGTIERAVNKNLVAANPENFATHLVLLTMTMSGSWLVRTELMQKINQEINQETADDTFDIQLELFAQSKVYYLDEATVVYRRLENSDSSITDGKKYLKRLKKLNETQWQYINKYPDLFFENIAANELNRFGLKVQNHKWHELSKEKDKQIFLFNNELSELKKHLAIQNQLLASKEAELLQKNQELNEIKNSFWYKVFKVFLHRASNDKK